MLKQLCLISYVLIGAVNLTDVTHYEILGVTKQASTQEIRQAYKKLAIRLHPDKNPEAAQQEKFLKITEAYETLKDPEKRRKYDLYGSYSYSRKYDYRSQSEYDNLYYNGLYHNDPFVDTLSGANFYNYLSEGFHFINFYSPFCPPCQNVADHWKKLAELYKGIVKVAAVNCKYHNSFCYNSMRIGSYPSLLFYPNGRHGNYIYYNGDRTLEALDNFVMKYIKTYVHVPTATHIYNTESPVAYILGSNRIDSNSLYRIAYQLMGVVTVAVIEDDNLRAKLTNDDYTTIVLKYRNSNKNIQSTEEKEVLKSIIETLSKVEQINPAKLKVIRNELRQGSETGWVLYFSSREADRLQLYQMNIAFPLLNFGEIDCDKYGELCSSLHVEEAPAWAVFNRGGGYQRAAHGNIKDFIQTASKATNLHTLSASDLVKILDGDVGTWVLLVVPYHLSWEHIADPFTRASLHFTGSNDVNFGIMACTLSTEATCREIAHNQPLIVVQNRTKRFTYNKRINEDELVDFVNLLRESVDMELKEQNILEILDVSSREHSWLVAYLPARCARICDDLLYEWMLVAKKLRSLKFVRVGALHCTANSGGFCNNVRSPTAKLYPIASGQHYTVSLQHLSQAPYMLEWALEYIDDSVQKLNWQTFSKTVVAEDLHPSSGKKPWLVYFHSPRCYRCYEMYADFAITGILLSHALQLGKVNCITERNLCQHEQITSYPSLRLYLNRNQQHKFSSIISIQVKDYENLLREIKIHIKKYDESLLKGVSMGISRGLHDEF